MIGKYRVSEPVRKRYMGKTLRPKEPRIPFTKAGYQKLLDEKSKLLSERPEAVEHLRKSRDMGDLSENGYYHASRARLSFIDGRIRRIERLIRLGVVVVSTDSDRIEIGKTITVTDGEKTYVYTIVGGYESDPSKNSISHISPLGRTLIGKQAGDTAEVHAPSGIKKYTILSIS
jgi:transcription elongation factor GreA